MKIAIETEITGQSKISTMHKTGKVKLNGEERVIIVAAVQTRTPVKETKVTERNEVFKNGSSVTQLTKHRDYKLTTVGFGLAVLNPEDEFNEALGLQIASGRAVTDAAFSSIQCSDNSLSLSVIETLLDKNLQHIALFPERFIPIKKKEVKEQSKEIKK